MSAVQAAGGGQVRSIGTSVLALQKASAKREGQQAVELIDSAGDVAQTGAARTAQGGNDPGVGGLVDVLA